MMEQRRLNLILGAVFLMFVCPSSEVPKNNLRRGRTEPTLAADDNAENIQHEEDDYYQEFLGVPMASSTDDFGVKGRPGIDFPNLAAIPITSFTCRNVKESGYFADMETKCQVFHICDGGRKMSFLCPNGTIFRQSHLICDWWFRVDCDDSQDYYEPSADTLRRDRERTKQDRMPSESRESMTITTEFRPPISFRSDDQQDGRYFYETTQPLPSGNQRAATAQKNVNEGRESNARRNDERRQLKSQVTRQQVQEKETQERNSNSRRGNSRSDEYITRNGERVNDKSIIRDPKPPETVTKPAQYFEQDPERGSNGRNLDKNFRDVNGQITSTNRRIDTVQRKNKDCNHDEGEGQILAETASFAGSHRRGRLESVTFSKTSEGLPIFEIPSKEDEKDSKIAEKPFKEEILDYIVTYKPTRDDETESVVTYRPVVDLEKFLHQRREHLSKNDDEGNEGHGKPYIGERAPPNIPLSSGPGAVHSLALYIATGGDNLAYNSPRRIEGSLKGIITTDPIPSQQSRDSITQNFAQSNSQKSSSAPLISPTTTANYKSASFLKESFSSPIIADRMDRKSATTESPFIITAPYLEYTTRSPTFNLESDSLKKSSYNSFPSSLPPSKDIPYVFVTSSISGKAAKITGPRGKVNNAQYLPTTAFSTTFAPEKTVTEKIHLKNTESPSLNTNLVTTFLPKDTSIPEIFKIHKKDSDVVNIRTPVITTLTKKEYNQEPNKNNRTILPENKSKISVDSVRYSTNPVEYSYTQRPTTINEAEGITFFEKEQYFRLDKASNKDLGSYLNKQLYSKEANHKKSDASAKKMKDYLLGNFTSEDSGLFQHINKALSETNTTNLTEDTMNILYKNAIESTLKEAMSVGIVTEPINPENMPTTEEYLLEQRTDNPSTTEEIPESSTDADERWMTKTPHSETIQITPFFKLENGKLTSTSSKFPEDDDLSTTPSDLRELAQVFSRALSAYLEDPETFREALTSVSHPPNPTVSSEISSDTRENLSNYTTDDDDDEVLDFSDVQVPSTTMSSHQTETTTKSHTGFYITIPFIPPTDNTPHKASNANSADIVTEQNAQGPDLEVITSPTTTIPETVTQPPIRNASGILSAQLRTQNDRNEVKIPQLEKQGSLEEEALRIESTTSKILEGKTSTETTRLPYKIYSTISSGKPITENLPPLEIDLLPPFQDPIPIREEPEDEKEDGFTEINIPTAALDEILNEFVPEELNRLAMTSIQPDEIPDNKNNDLSSYINPTAPNSVNTYNYENKDKSSTHSAAPSSTTPLPSELDSSSYVGQDILTRIASKLPQANSQGKNPQINSVSYSTYTNQLLKSVTNSVTEKDESLIRAHTSNFIPSQPPSNQLHQHVSNVIPEESTPALEELSPTEDTLIEKTTPFMTATQDYEFINRTSENVPSRSPPIEPLALINREPESNLHNGEERTFQGNPRLVLLFVNDHNAKGRGINEKNARLLKALLRTDDHHFLRSAGLIPDVTDKSEPTTSTTTEYNPYTITSLTSRTPSPAHKTNNTSSQPNSSKIKVEPRTEPPITTYAPKFTMTWTPLKKPRSTNRNNTLKAEKLQAIEPTKLSVEETTPINLKGSTSSTSSPSTKSTDLANSTNILGGEDKSTVSDGRAFDLLRSLYSLTARWG